MLLTDFTDRFLEALLDLIWAQWSSVGAAGLSGLEGRGLMVDPEVLLLFSATMARHDQRLSDEMPDWLITEAPYRPIRCFI
jgi:hypothetical protein